MKVAIGCDHGGFILKDAVIGKLKELGAEVKDFGTFSTDSCDYPVYAKQVAEAVASGDCECGVLLCGTGIGISIAANKVKGIRAGVAHDVFTATAVKQHNHANVLCMGGRCVPPELAAEMVEAWIKTEPEGGRHDKRLAIVKDIEDKYFK